MCLTQYSVFLRSKIPDQSSTYQEWDVWDYFNAVLFLQYTIKLLLKILSFHCIHVGFANLILGALWTLSIMYHACRFILICWYLGHFTNLQCLKKCNFLVVLLIPLERSFLGSIAQEFNPATLVSIPAYSERINPY